MAIEKVVNISVKETGMDALRSKVEALENSLDSLEEQNESLRKSIANTGQSVLDNGGAMGLLNDATGGLAMTIKDAVEAGELFTKSEKAKAIAVKISSVVIGTSTGALKALRIALAATGVGALVIGLGLLIANFDKVTKFVQSGIDKFKGLSNTTKTVISVLMPLVGVIRLVTYALEELGVIEDDQSKKLRIQAEERERIRRKELATLTKAKEQIADSYDFEIAKLKASGKDTEKVEALKRDAILKTLYAQNARDRAYIASGKASQEDIKIWNERQKEIISTIKEIEIAENESNFKKLQLQKEANEKQKEEARKLAEDKKRKLEEEFKTFMDFYNKQLEAEANRQNAIIEIRKSYTEKLRDLEAETELEKIELEEERALAELERLNATEAEKSELRTYYAKLTNDEIIKLAEEGAQKRAEMQANADAIELNARQAFEDAKYSIANQGLELLGTLGGKSKAIATTMLLIEKGLAISQVVTNASRAIAQASANLAATPAVIGVAPNPAYPIQAAATAKGIATTKISAGLAIGNILAQTIGKLSSSGSVGGGSNGGGGGSVPSAPSFNLVQGTGTNQIAESLASERNPVKAYVVASEVSTQQSLDRNIESGARL